MFDRRAIREEVGRKPRDRFVQVVDAEGLYRSTNDAQHRAERVGSGGGALQEDPVLEVVTRA